MDESHRLKPMVDYDPKVFDFVYSNTKALIKKLAWDIDPRKYGVEYEEMVSWFTVKMLFVFNKHYNDERCIDNREQKIKGFVISALQMYKRKVVLDSYKGKQALNQTLDITEIYSQEDLLIEEVDNEMDDQIKLVKEYFKRRLSDDAYFLFELELNPPPYILSQFPDNDKIPKLTTELVADYLGIPLLDENGKETYYREYFKSLHREIKDIRERAKEYFKPQY